VFCYRTVLSFFLTRRHSVFSHVARMLHHVVFHFIVRCVGFGWGGGVVWYGTQVRSYTSLFRIFTRGSYVTSRCFSFHCALCGFWMGWGCGMVRDSGSILDLHISYIHTWLVCYITLFFISLCAVWVLDGERTRFDSSLSYVSFAV